MKRTHTSQEAFKIWYAAYTRNYAGTGLVVGETLAQQAWQACENNYHLFTDVPHDSSEREDRLTSLENTVKALAKVIAGIEKDIYKDVGK